MIFTFRSTVCAALLVAASTAFGSSAAPNVQVTVKQGKTELFKGITDGSGRFTTLPLDPGIYRFELRALKTAPPAQYFLLLSGAKPVTTAMADKKAVLMMDAQVRRPRSVTGQVTARRIRIIAPTPPTAPDQLAPVGPASRQTAVARPPAPPARALASDVISRPAATPRAAAAPATTTSPPPVAYQRRMINGRPHIWVPSAPGSTLGRWVPERP